MYIVAVREMVRAPGIKLQEIGIPGREEADLNSGGDVRLARPGWRRKASELATSRPHRAVDHQITSMAWHVVA